MDDELRSQSLVLDKFIKVIIDFYDRELRTLTTLELKFYLKFRIFRQNTCYTPSWYAVSCV